VLADIAVVVASFWVASVLRQIIPLGRGGTISAEGATAPAWVYFIAVACWMLGLVYSGAYDPQLALRWFAEALRVASGGTIATILMAGALFLTFRELSRLQFVYFLLVAVLAMWGYRAALRTTYRLTGKRRPGGRNRVLVIGAGDLGRKVARFLLDHSRWGFKPLGFLDDDPVKRGITIIEELKVLGSIDQTKEIVEQMSVEEIWVALPATALQRLSEIISRLEMTPVRIKVVPDYFSFALIRTNPEVFGDLAVIGLRDPLIDGIPRAIKRLFDLVVGFLLLVTLSPLMILLALLIVLDSMGPPVFKQQRVGENGRFFDMFKFRTMTVAEESPQPPREAEIHKVRNDPRVTRIGRWMRRYSLDELPQLLNVIRGDMSLVGPRPEMPSLVERYEPWQRKRFAVPQGLTGWWQINGRSDRPMHLHTEDDLYYVYNYSLWMDVYILLRTPFDVLRGRGAF
jgi:exopolysaccharide biosynthesis polyprenyl glycosylphosphotransferase